MSDKYNKDNRDIVIKMSASGKPFYFDTTSGNSYWKLPHSKDDIPDSREKLSILGDVKFEEPNFELFEEFCDQFIENSDLKPKHSLDSIRNEKFFEAFGSKRDDFFKKYNEKHSKKQIKEQFKAFLEKFTVIFEYNAILDFKIFSGHIEEISSEFSALQKRILFQNFLFCKYFAQNELKRDFKGSLISLKKIESISQFISKLYTHIIVEDESELYFQEISIFIESFDESETIKQIESKISAQKDMSLQEIARIITKYCKNQLLKPVLLIKYVLKSNSKCK